MSDPTISHDSIPPEENPEEQNFLLWGKKSSSEDTPVESWTSFSHLHGITTEFPEEDTCNKCGKTYPIDEFLKNKYGDVIKYHCRQCRAEYQKAYKNSEQGRAVRKVVGQKRYAQKKGLAHDLSTSDWQYALTYFNNCCAVCKRPATKKLKIAMDHWIPISKGGGSTRDNVVPLCHGVDGCNNSKNNSDAEEWLKYMFTESEVDEILQRINAYFEHIKSTDSKDTTE